MPAGNDPCNFIVKERHELCAADACADVARGVRAGVHALTGFDPAIHSM
jgi:hypothetical protein